MLAALGGRFLECACDELAPPVGFDFVEGDRVDDLVSLLGCKVVDQGALVDDGAAGLRGLSIS